MNRGQKQRHECRKTVIHLCPRNCPPDQVLVPAHTGFLTLETLTRMTWLNSTKRRGCMVWPHVSLRNPLTAPMFILLPHVGEVPENSPSSSARTLDIISRPIARLPTADDLIFSSSQSSTPHKRKHSSEGDKSSPLKKSRTLPLECTNLSSKGKGIARDAPVEDLIQAVYHSFIETCSCPM